MPYFCSDTFAFWYGFWSDTACADLAASRGNFEQGRFGAWWPQAGRPVAAFALNRPDDQGGRLREGSAGTANSRSNGRRMKRTAGPTGVRMPTFATDIRLLFREKDIKTMAFAFDLADFEDVKANADGIYERLAGGSMPCDGEWPAAQLALFRRWIDEGFGI